MKIAFSSLVFFMLLTAYQPPRSSVSKNEPAQRQMEYLDRGVVALPDGKGNIFISWRLLGTDSEAVAFNIYRAKKQWEGHQTQ